METDHNLTMDEDYYYRFKVLLIGDSGVGKTSLLDNVAGRQTDKFACTTLMDADKKIQFLICDTSSFATTDMPKLKRYLDEADGVILIYDVTSEVSFTNLKSYWINFVQENGSRYIRYMIVGNKCDLEGFRMVSTQMGMELSCNGFSSQMAFRETSVGIGYNNRAVFMVLCRELYQRRICHFQVQVAAGNVLEKRFTSERDR